jgi:hypothetical protein
LCASCQAAGRCFEAPHSQASRSLRARPRPQTARAWQRQRSQFLFLQRQRRKFLLLQRPQILFRKP